MIEHDTYQYPPELFALLVDTIPLLCRSKRDVLLFFRGAGMTPTAMFEVEDVVRSDKDALNKFEIARRLLTILNEAGDPALATRRELLRRVVQFEDFTRCWESDVMKAKGLVAEIQRVVNVKDSFTRMSQARAEEQAAAKALREAQRRAEVEAAKVRKAAIAEAKGKLFALFGDGDAHRRGKQLEGVLNDLFRAYGVLVAEDFRRKGGGTSGVVEQIDGVVEIDNDLYLVEMKWWGVDLGPGDISPHITRLMMRNSVSGIFISASNFTPAALETCRDFLQHRVLVLCTLREIVALLEREGDLPDFIRTKVRAAKLERTPFKEILN